MREIKKNEKRPLLRFFHDFKAETVKIKREIIRCAKELDPKVNTRTFKWYMSKYGQLILDSSLQNVSQTIDVVNQISWDAPLGYG